MLHLDLETRIIDHFQSNYHSIGIFKHQLSYDLIVES